MTLRGLTASSEDGFEPTLDPAFAENVRAYGIPVPMAAAQAGASLTIGATVADGDELRITVMKDGGAVRLNPSTIADNALTLMLKNVGGPGGGVGIQPPFDAIFTPNRGGTDGIPYVVSVTTEN